MWHASLSPRIVLPLTNRDRHLFALALEQLAEVGDASAGEWRRTGGSWLWPDLVVVHVRRRLSAVEAAAAGIVDLVDVRGTPTHAARVEALRPFLPDAVAALPAELIP